MKKINWKVFLMLWIAATLSVVAVLPYTLDLQSSTLQQLDLPIPLPLLIAIQMLQNAILFAVMIFLGMVLADQIGLGMPTVGDAMTNALMRQFVEKQTYQAASSLRRWSARRSSRTGSGRGSSSRLARGRCSSTRSARCRCNSRSSC